MARRRSTNRFFSVIIIILAAVGGYTIYRTHEAQTGIKSAEKMMKKVVKSANAAEKAWR